ncbi:MAG: hypothetical protein ACRD2I_21400 [Vicinamibacterales bacterium]
MAGSLLSFWRWGTKAERVAYAVGALLIGSGLVHLAILIVSGGTWHGPVSMRKPTTFGLSFGLTLITIVWVSAFLPLRSRTRAALVGIFSVACVIETALVTLQAWRGVPSHFNIETTFDAIVARALAVGGLTLVVIIVSLTAISFRANVTVPRSLLTAIRVGFIALLGAQLAGAAMIVRGMTLALNGDPPAAYASGGMLKPAHAMMMHGVLILPALAWILSFVGWSERRRLEIVLLAASGYVLVSGVVTLANLDELLGLHQPPLLKAALLAIGAASFGAAGAITLFGVAQSDSVDGVHRVATGPARARWRVTGSWPGTRR